LEVNLSVPTFRKSSNQAVRLTASGVAALAVVRVVGEGLDSFFARRFDRALVAGKPVHGNLADDSGIIDDPLVLLARDGSWADISLHGGSWVVEATLQLLRADGFEIVEPNELDAPSIAFPVADAIEREMLTSLPLARTDLALRVLLNQPSAWKTIDRTDDRLLDLIRSNRALEHLLHPPTIALIGVPNAGKSSLANRLFGMDRSIVSEHAGTTRDWVGEDANLDGLIVKLIDTPGVRASDDPIDDPIEREAIARSSPVVKQAQLVITVLDPTLDIDEQLARTRDAQPRVADQAHFAVLNKCDLFPTSDGIEHLASFVHPISAMSGFGVDSLIQKIRQHFGVDQMDESKPRAWNDRTRAMLTRGI